MAVYRHLSILSTCGILLLAAAIAIPATRGTAQDADLAPALGYDLSGSLAAASQDAGNSQDTGAQANTDRTAALDPAELECMAKVVRHEAGNQPRLGQIAVAQTLVNRMQSGRFAGSICAVANQRGQFFPTAAYSPPHDAYWDVAVAVARDTMLGNSEQAAPGALFFHGVRSTKSGFMRGRQRVATIGGHVVYR